MDSRRDNTLARCVTSRMQSLAETDSNFYSICALHYEMNSIMPMI